MTGAGSARKLDINRKNLLSSVLEDKFAHKVVGQDKATQVLIDILEKHLAGFGDPTQPAGNALFLGPTGTGKTHVVETFAEALFGTKQACIRIDCAEFQHSHEIAKLIGSPPGYLGHRETHPALTQEALDRFQTPERQFSILLFDEIEKASDSLWSLLLGILDKASLTLGDNRKVNFKNVIILMTSNVGAREMANRGIGYLDPTEEYDQVRMEQIALSAVKSKFQPEFMNRIQNVVTFQSLTQAQINSVLDMELDAFNTLLHKAYMSRAVGEGTNFSIAVSPAAKSRLALEGYDKAYGARHVKRSIDRLIQKPLSKLFTSGQIHHNDIVVIDDNGGETLEFYVHGVKP